MKVICSQDYPFQQIPSHKQLKRKYQEIIRWGITAVKFTPNLNIVPNIKVKIKKSTYKISYCAQKSKSPPRFAKSDANIILLTLRSILQSVKYQISVQPGSNTFWLWVDHIQYMLWSLCSFSPLIQYQPYILLYTIAILHAILWDLQFGLLYTNKCGMLVRSR